MKFYGRTEQMKRILVFILFIFLIVSSKAISQAHQKGSYTAVFEEYSPLSGCRTLSERMRISISPGAYEDHRYDIKQESFEVYAPDSYDPNTPFGLMVWISPSSSGAIDHYPGLKALMEKYKLVWVGANNSGNEHFYESRRVPLALDGSYNMQKLYTIDPDRVYVAGLSGGGRVASITAFHHSDVYAGGIFIIGANYWLQMAVPGKENTYWKPNFPRPRQENLVRAKKFGRYVLLTGDHDGNRVQMHTYYEEGYSKWLDHVLYIQVPEMGHEMPPAEEVEKAIKFLDEPLSQEEAKESED